MLMPALRLFRTIPPKMSRRRSCTLLPGGFHVRKELPRKNKQTLPNAHLSAEQASPAEILSQKHSLPAESASCACLFSHAKPSVQYRLASTRYSRTQSLRKSIRHAFPCAEPPCSPRIRQCVATCRTAKFFTETICRNDDRHFFRKQTRNTGVHKHPPYGIPSTYSHSESPPISRCAIRHPPESAPYFPTKSWRSICPFRKE